MVYKLTYFPIRGLAETIRITLKDNEIPYEETGVENWPELKQMLTKDGTLPFGQLPLFRDGDLNIVQSNAILRYIARKHNLYGANETERVQVDMYLDGVMDFRQRYTRLIYIDKLADEAFDAFKKDVVPVWMSSFENILKKNNSGDGYFVGSDITVVDYAFFELMGSQIRSQPEIFEGYPTLKAWYERMESRPNIAAYFKEDAEWRKFANANGLG